MAPAGQYVFAEMLGISEHFTAGSHEWLPYSVIPTFPKLICKHQFIVLPGQAGSYWKIISRVRKNVKFSGADCISRETVVHS